MRARNGSRSTRPASPKAGTSARAWVGLGLIGLGGLAVALPGIPGFPFILAGAFFLPQAHPMRRKVLDIAARCCEAGARAAARPRKAAAASAAAGAFPAAQPDLLN